jgi:hypothetical protein
VAHPQPESTDEIVRYAPLYLDAYLERYGFTLARDRLAGLQWRWLIHESCGWREHLTADLPVRIIFNLAARHLSQECEQHDHSE